MKILQSSQNRYVKWHCSTIAFLLCWNIAILRHSNATYCLNTCMNLWTDKKWDIFLIQLLNVFGNAELQAYRMAVSSRFNPNRFGSRSEIENWPVRPFVRSFVRRPHSFQGHWEALAWDLQIHPRMENVIFYTGMASYTNLEQGLIKMLKIYYPPPYKTPIYIRLLSDTKQKTQIWQCVFIDLKVKCQYFPVSNRQNAFTLSDIESQMFKCFGKQWMVLSDTWYSRHHYLNTNVCLPHSTASQYFDTSEISKPRCESACLSSPTPPTQDCLSSSCS